LKYNLIDERAYCLYLIDKHLPFTNEDIDISTCWDVILETYFLMLDRANENYTILINTIVSFISYISNSSVVISSKKHVLHWDKIKPYVHTRKDLWLIEHAMPSVFIQAIMDKTSIVSNMIDTQFVRTYLKSTPGFYMNETIVSMYPGVGDIVWIRWNGNKRILESNVNSQTLRVNLIGLLDQGLYSNSEFIVQRFISKCTSYNQLGILQKDIFETVLKYKKDSDKINLIRHLLGNLTRKFNEFGYSADEFLKAHGLIEIYSSVE
jgi:hypothetical protein